MKVLMSIATWSSGLWSPWHEAILTWLGLLEGILVPLLLFCKDNSLRTALRRTFQRRSGALSPLVGDDGPFQMYFDKDHFRKRGTFGSVTPVGIITNYRRTPGKKRRCKKSGSGAKYTLPGLHSGDSVLAKSCFGSGFLGGEPLSKLSCADLTSLEMWREEEEENFYASLSDDFSTFSCKSADDSALSEDIREELYGGSFTTIANDDFEFHDTRPCGGEVKMRPALAVTPPPTNNFTAGVSRNVSFRENLLSQEPLETNISQSKGSELFDFVTSPVDEDQKDSHAFILPATEWKYSKIENESTSPSDLSSNNTSSNTSNNKFGTMSRQKKSTSFSLNDLDLINKRENTQYKDTEANLMLPVKSESTMSLYRLNVERDLDQMAMTPSKSENNVNGDSGFGSGAQSTNPVWSGFLCRKPSDPFWNIRKPTVVATAISPTSNYSAILHPRMRKIPWISAWKKLDSNNECFKKLHTSESYSKDKIVWTDPSVYGVKKSDVQQTPLDNQVTTIEEELSDAGTPIYTEDYNLNIFAKESGVLLENAYGKIERDDCGVKVNFYGENVQFDIKGSSNENKESVDNVFDTSFESDKPVYDLNRLSSASYPDNFKIENHVYEPLNVKKGNNEVQILHTSSGNKNRHFSGENIGVNSNENYNYKCELRLNGGHYENLFGTKENIFAHCDQYKSKIDVYPGNSNCERKSSDRRDSGRFKHSNYASVNLEASSIYGHLKKPERKDSFNHKNSEISESPSKDVCRKISDNRSKKCGIKRKESKTRNDDKPEMQKTKKQFENSNFHEFDYKEITQNDKNRNKIEFEMTNVPGRDNLNCNIRNNRLENDDFRVNVCRRDSQNKRARESSQEDTKPKTGNQNRPEYIEIRDDRGIKIIRRESFPQDLSREKKYMEDCDRIYVEPKDILWQVHMDRKDSGRQANVEWNDSGRRAGLEPNSKRRLSADRYNSPRRISAECKDNSRRASVERTESGRHINIQRRDSGRCENMQRREGNFRGANIRRTESDRCANMERRESSKIAKVERRDSSKIAKLERRDSARNARDNNSQVERRDSNIYSRRNGFQKKESPSKKFGEMKNEGLWVNAIPFDTDQGNSENTPRRESRKEAYDLHRSPRKSSIVRRESSGRTGDPLKRKVSGSKGTKNEQIDDPVPNKKVQKKEFAKWPPRSDDSHLDDFLKYRDKCEDNFSHIQNINRETSAEREYAKVEQLRCYGKPNGNTTHNDDPVPFETSQDQKKSLYQSSRPVSDINDNCGQNKLAITDFL